MWGFLWGLMIIGVTGQTGSGKDSVAHFLSEQGFIHYSLSDVIRKKLREQNKPLTRENEILMGNTLRKEKGDAVLVEEILKGIKEEKDYVITSIRHPAEIQALKMLPEFFLIKINAPPQLRYERWKQRHSSHLVPMDLTFEQFQRLDQQELYGDGHSQNLRICMEMAQECIINDTTLEELRNRVMRVLARVKSGEKRPSWDEYFIRIAHLIGSRGTCDRGRSGCVIVRDKHILTTGYVGSPSGLAHCTDAGHLLHDVFQDGQVTQHCIRTTHAEQNALAQAARYGISVEGGTLYCKMEPCHVCAKMIINAGIKRVVAEKKYQRAELSRQFFKEAGVLLEVLYDEVEEY